MKFTISRKHQIIFAAATLAGVLLVLVASMLSSENVSSQGVAERVDNEQTRAATRQVISQNNSPAPKSIASQLRIAMNQVDNGEVDEAAETLDEILKRDPNNIKALLELSLIELLDRGRPEKALPFLIRALDVEPENDYLLGEVADIYVETSRFREGLKFFYQLKEHFPESDGIRLRIGQIYYYQGSYPRALESLASLNHNNQHGFQAKSLIARIYLHLNQLQEAKQLYEEAEEGLELSIRRAMISGKPADFLVKWLDAMQIELAEIYLNKGLAREAEDVLYKLSEKSASDPEVVRLMDLAKSKLLQDAGAY